MTHTTGRIVVAGESLVDVITSPTGEVREATGGGPYTTARTIARLEQHAVFLGCVSRDRLGVRMMDELTADRVDLSLVVRTGAPTTIAHVALDAAGSATYRFDIEGTAAPALDVAAAMRALEPRPAALHVGTLGLVFEPSGTSLERLVGAVADDTLVMLDPNARPSAIPDLAAWRARIERIARRADVIRVSTEDLAVIDPGRDPMDVARELSAARAVVLASDGPRPVRVLIPGADPIELPVPRLPVVDTVGAGDAFGGGFLASWIGRARPIEDLRDPDAVVPAVRSGITISALTCGRRGADPPRLAELGFPFPG